MKGIDVENSEINNEDEQDDLSSAGVKLMLDSLYSSEYDEPNNSIILKAKFYERKSNIVYTKLMNKLSHSEAILINKTKLERTLRLENHAASIKIRKNRIYI